MSKTPHIVIVGAGFGGLEVAEQLAHVPVKVTLIDRHNYHTLVPSVRFRLATVTGVGLEGRAVATDVGEVS